MEEKWEHSQSTTVEIILYYLTDEGTVGEFDLQQ